jgi:hypothetical protein
VRIDLVEYESVNGCSQLVWVSVSEHGDEITARDIIAVAALALARVRFSVQKWMRSDDTCYEIQRLGGAKALDKVTKALTSMGLGYEKIIVRSVRAPREVR